MSKRVTVVILAAVDIPDDWEIYKLEHHLRKGCILLGETRDIDEVTDTITIDNVMVELQ